MTSKLLRSIGPYYLINENNKIICHFTLKDKYHVY